MAYFKDIAAVHYTKVLLYTGATPPTPRAEALPALRNYFADSATVLEVPSLRTLPSFGNRANLTNQPVFGSGQSLTVSGQSDATPMEFELNYLPEYWASSTALTDLRTTGRVTLLAVAMLPRRAPGPLLTSADIGSVEHAVYYCWGFIGDTQIVPSRTDAAVTKFSFFPVSEWYGPDTVSLEGMVDSSFYGLDNKSWYDVTAGTAFSGVELGLATPDTAIGLVLEGIPPSTLSTTPVIPLGLDFTAPGWTSSGSPTSAGPGVVTTAGVGGYTWTSLVVGKSYLLTFSVTSTVGTVAVYNATNATNLLATGTTPYTAKVAFTAVNANLHFRNTAAATTTWANFSLVELPSGLSAAQTSATLRPTLGAAPLAIKNLLVNTNFSGAVAGTPGTAPSSWAVFQNTGSITGYDSVTGTLSISVTNQRVVLYQTRSIGANSSNSLSVVVTAVSGSLSYEGIVAAVNLPVGYIKTYYKDGTVVDSSDLVTGPCTITCCITTSATAGSINWRLGAGVMNSGTGSVSFKEPQLEAGTSRTAYQFVSNSQNVVTETGATVYNFLRWDGVDDSMPINLPASTTGELVIIGRNGSYREAYTGASTALGGTNQGYAGLGFPMLATGPVLAYGFRPGIMSQAEWRRLINAYRERGAGGQLLYGAELLTNGTFDTDLANWTTNSGSPAVTGGALVLPSDSVAGSRIYQSITGLVIGQPYLLAGTAITSTGTGLTDLALSSTMLISGSIGTLRFNAGATNLTLSRVVVPTATTMQVVISKNNTASSSMTFDNLSLKPITVEGVL